MDMTTLTNDNSDCRKLSTALGLVGDKWTVMIIATLLEQPRRFNEIRRMTDGISQQMLTRTLKALERDGMVCRTVYPTVPPQVEYALTALGVSLAIPIRALGDWAKGHFDEIENNRAAYDRRSLTGAAKNRA